MTSQDDEGMRELQAELRDLKVQVRRLNDIYAIEKLQKSYSYYIEHGMAKEIMDLFADQPDVSAWHSGVGAFIGMESIRKLHTGLDEVGRNPEYLHQIVATTGIVDVADDGFTAQGRWYGLGQIAAPLPEGASQLNMSVIYENDYLKEEGVWKIHKLRVYIVYDYRPSEGFVKPERLSHCFVPTDLPQVEVDDEMGNLPQVEGKDEMGMSASPLADIPDHTDYRYPSGYIVPFHFEHPVTGEKTSEDERNAALSFSHVDRLMPH
jgi:hypothetical protein